MFASIFIIVFSAALLLYWFRYSCVLLLQNREQATAMSTADQASFRFNEVQDRLRSDVELAPLHALLQRDYQVLTYLAKNAYGLGLSSMEERLLVWDYKLMAFWYSLTQTAAPEQARQALGEMASVLDFLAGRIGERAGASSRA